MKIVREEYYSNGQIEYQSTIDDLGIGHDQAYHINGNKWIDFYFKNGCFGIYKHWHPFGSLAKIEQNKQGVLNGLKINFKYGN